MFGSAVVDHSLCSAAVGEAVHHGHSSSVIMRCPFTVTLNFVNLLDFL